MIPASPKSSRMSEESSSMFQRSCPTVSPSPSKKRFQRLRVRSLSRSRASKTKNQPEEDYSQEISMSRRNNSTGNLSAVDPSAHRNSLSGSLSRASRSTLHLIQNAQKSTLRHLSKSWESLSRMGDGRNVHIILLDGRKIEIFVQSTLTSEELLDIVSLHYNLKEKEYFGLAYQDETGHYNWLQLDRRVLDHELSLVQKKHKFIVLYFMVKFFVESITHLRDPVTVELFYLQARILVVKDLVQTEQETAFELAAYVLHSCYGDFVSLDATKESLKKQPVLSENIVKGAASYAYCEERVGYYYQKLQGLPKGNAIVNYMTIIESLSTYGVHYYAVTDKSGGSYFLGISYKGLGQYKYDDKKVPERVFMWKDLGNLFYRDKKFSAEVLEARRVVHALSSINLYENAIEEPLDQSDDLSNAISDPTTQVCVSRRTFAPGQLSVHVWFAASAALAKAIWTMAINQHQFYLEKKKIQNGCALRTPSKIATDLTESVNTYHIFDPFRPRSGSENSSQSYRIVRDGSLTSGFASEDSISQLSETEKKEMYLQAKTRRDALDARLKERIARLKELCIQEAQVTGELPQETPLAPGELPPQVRRRIGTTFELASHKVDTDALTKEDKDLAALELHYELQLNITKAAERLMKDAGGKTIRKQRKSEYRKAHAKLKDLERQLKEMRLQMDRDHPSFDSQEFQISHSSSLSSGLGDSSSLQSFNRPPQSPAMSLRSSNSHSSVSIPEISNASPSRSASNGSLRPGTGPYTPSTVYQTRNPYRIQQYPTLSPTYKNHEPISGLSEFHTGSSQPPRMHLDKPNLEPVIINHPIIVEAPTRIISSRIIPPRSASLDRSHSRIVSDAVLPVSAENFDSRYSTLDIRSSRQKPIGNSVQKVKTVEYQHHFASPPVTKVSAHSPSPGCYTSELTKPYEISDFYKYSNRVRKLNRTTPEESDAPRSPGPHKLHALSPSPSTGPNRQYCLAPASSPSGGSSSSTRTVSPKYPSSSMQAQVFMTARPLQCLSTLPRAREAQISWNEDGMPKTPTIV